MLGLKSNYGDTVTNKISKTRLPKEQLENKQISYGFWIACDQGKFHLGQNILNTMVRLPNGNKIFSRCC